MESLISNPDSVILTQLFGILNDTFQCKGGWRTLFRTLGVGVLKLVASFLIHRLVKSNDVWNILRFVMLRTIYLKRVLTKSNIHQSAMIDAFNALVSSPSTSPTSKDMAKPSESLTQDAMKQVWVSGLPVYLDKEGMDFALYSLPFVHAAFVHQLSESADTELKEAEFVQTVTKDANGKEYTPMNLFASNNYRKLDNILHTHFIVGKDTGMVGPLFIVLNGEAGLGKSNSSHYLAKQGKYGEIRHISLTAQSMVTRSFTSIINEITSKRSPYSTIVYFDELDKYMDMFIRNTYSSSKKGGSADGVVVDDDYAVFVNSVKTNTIMSIAELANNCVSFPHGVAFVFCSNNFHTLFEGVDPTHVDSVKTRFNFLQFELCGKDELCRYLTTFTERITIPRLKYTPEKLNAAFANIRPDLQVTYRDIQNLHSIAAYDIDVFVQRINQEVHNPLISPTSPPNIPSSNESIANTPIKSKPSAVPFVQSVIPKEELRESRIQAKKTMEETIVYMINIISDPKIGNVECYANILEKTTGMDLVEMAETSLPGDDICEELDEFASDMCPLNAIVRFGRIELLEHLIRLGVDAMVCDQVTGEIPLHVALGASMRSCEPEMKSNIRRCVEILLSDGGVAFDPNKSIGWRFVTCNPGLSDPDNEQWITQVLTRVLANAKITSPYSPNVIHTLIQSAYSSSLIQLVHSLGCCMDRQGNNDDANLPCAVMQMVKSEHDYLPVIQTLVECGADVKAEYYNSLLWTLSDVPDLKRVKEVAEYLVAHGAERVFRSNGYVYKSGANIQFKSRSNPEVTEYLKGLVFA